MPSEKSTSTPTADRVGAQRPDSGFIGAHLGGMMQVDGDRFRIGVLAIDRSVPRAALQVLHRDDRSLNRVVEVKQGEEFTVGQHRVRVVTLNDTAVAITWSAPQDRQ
jgi:hypothetical protein